MTFRAQIYLGLGILLFASIGPHVSLAQMPDDSKLEKNRAVVRNVGARVEVKLKNGTKLKGDVENAADDSFTLLDSKTGTRQSIAYADIDSAKNARGGLKPSTWIIIGAAAAAAVILSITVVKPVLCDGGAGC